MQDPSENPKAQEGHPLRLPPELEHQVMRGVRAQLVRNELLNLGTPQARDFFHESFGLNLRIQRPHEIMVVLVIRPFHESQLDVPLARVARLLFGSVLPLTLRRSAGERWARGVAFVGLRKRRDIFLTSLIVTFGVPIVAGMLTLVAVIRGGPLWWSAAGLVGAWALLRTIRGWAQDRKLKIRNRDDLARVLDQVRRRAIGPLTFFRATDDIWKETVQELAKLASLIFADVGRRGEGLEWELAELGRTSNEKFVVWAINPDYNWGSGKLATSPDDERIEVLITAFGGPIVDRIAGHLGTLRGKYDASVAREVLTRALSEERWVETFWKGISAITEQRLDVAESIFSSAWQVARPSTSWYAMYPGVALLDTLAMIEAPEDRIELLVDDLTQLLADLRRGTGNQTRRVPGESPAVDNQLHQDARIEESMRLLFYEFDSRPEVPLALWQFQAILGGGIRRLVSRGLSRRYDAMLRSTRSSSDF
jgi:hypothetical protein